MRIPDIVAAHTAPGATVVDLTPDGAGLATYLALPPPFGVGYTRELPPAADARAERLVTRVIPPDAREPWRFASAAGTKHLVFFERIEDAIAAGVLEAAAQDGLELLAAEPTQQKPFRLAAVFGAPRDPARARLRLVNESRFDKLVLRVREEELARTAARAQRAEKNDLKLEATTAENAALRARLERAEAERDRLTHAHADAVRAIGELRQTTAALHERLDRVGRRLISARRSISFRVGRAATLAVRGSSWNLLALPARFVGSLRAADEVLDEIATSSDPGTRERGGR